MKVLPTMQRCVATMKAAAIKTETRQGLHVTTSKTATAGVCPHLPIDSVNARRSGARRQGLGLLVSALVLCGLVASPLSYAQVASDFNVTVNTGPVAPNSPTVFPGEATSLRITLANNSTTANITGAGFNQPLPSTATHSLLIDGTATISGDPGCTGGVLAAASGQGSVSLTGLTVPARQAGVAGSGECYIDLPIIATSNNGASTSLSYGLFAGDVSSDQGTNATGGPQSITVSSTRRPTWSKALFPNDILVLGGATRTMRIVVNNPDPNVTMNDIAFTDVFPTSGSDGAIAEPTGAAGTSTCGGAVAITQGAAAAVGFSGGTLAPGASCIIEVEVRGRQTNGIYNRQVTNSIPASGFTNSSGLRPTANANRQMRARSPLSVVKNFTPSIVASGEANTLRIQLFNAGSVALPVTNFTDNPIAAAPFSDRLNIANVGDITNSCAGGTVTLEGGGQGFSVGGFDIPAGGNCTIDVTYTGLTPGADIPSTYTNRIPQGAVQTTVPGIVSQGRTATVLVADRLRVLKSVSPANAVPGDPVRYQVTVQNFSAGAVNNVNVVDDLPNGATLLLGGAFDPTLTPACGALGLNGAAQGDTSVTFSIPTLPGRTGTNTPGTCVISFSAMLDPDGSGPTVNQIPAGAVCFGGTCNGVGSGNATTNDLDTLSLAKTFDAVEDVSKTEGTTTRLRLLLQNNAINPLTNLTLSDTLPNAGPLQQLVVATPANVSNTCGGTVTAAAGSTSVALNGGSVPALSGGTPGQCALELDVVGPAGTYPNTADASAVRQNADGSATTLNDSDGANLVYTGALETEKVFSPTQSASGGTSTVTIRFTSLDPARPITGVAVTDPLPAGMVVADPANAFTSCNGSTVVDATPGAGSAGISGAVLAPSTSCELVFDVEATGTADWVNVIPPGGVTADGSLTNLSPVTATLNYVAPESPTISKSITPGTIVPGQSALLTVTITNGAQSLSNLSLSDFFTVDGVQGSAANGMTIAPAPDASTNCTDGVVVASPGGQFMRIEGATLPANTSCEFSVQVTSTTVGTITNTIPVDSIVTAEGTSNSTTFAQSTLNTTSDAGIGKMFTPPVVSPNEISVLRLTIFNGRNEAVTGLSLEDVFPAGLEIAPDPAPFSNCGGGVTITFPTTASVRLDNGIVGPATGATANSCYVEVNVLSSVEGTYVNTIAADTLLSNGTPVPHPGVDATLQVRERLEVHKAFDDLTLDAGDPAGFTTGVAARLPGDAAPLTIRLSNPNDIPVTQVTFVDRLPDGIVLAAPPILATDCTAGSVTGMPSGREVTLTGATLGAVGSADASCTVTAEVVGNIPGVYTNEIAAGDVTSFEGIDNLPGTQAQIVITEPPVLSKEFSPPVVAPGVSTTLSLLIGNPNDADTTLTADLVDNLPGTPGQMVVATPPNITTSCPGGPGIVSAAAGAVTVTVDSGAAIPAGGCDVTVDVTAPVDGDYLNNIPVGALVTGFGVNQGPAEAPLRVSSLGFISGKVFLDNQPVPDGTFLPGDSTPIAGNTVVLRSGADCSGAVLDTVTTDAQGNYLFTDLPAGTYSVCQPTQPADTLNSVTTPGTIAPVAGSTGTVGTALNPPGGVPTSQITGIVLNDSGNANEVSGSPDNNFSEVVPASVAGTVFFDANGNGVLDVNEGGIAGVTINLTGPVNASVVTDANGDYSFEGLPPGDYTVTEVQPTAFIDGTDIPGTVDGTPVGDGSVNDVISSITLGPGDAGIDYDFGEELDNAALAVNVNGFCSDDAGYIDYDVPAFSGGGAGTPPPVTIRLLTVGGRLVGQFTGQPPSGMLLWPGTQVDASGVGVAWPGWAFANGEWSEVPDDRIPDLVVEVTADGGLSAQALVSYPRSRAGCLLQPAETFARDIPLLPLPLLWLLVGVIGLIGASAVRKGPLQR